VACTAFFLTDDQIEHGENEHLIYSGPTILRPLGGLDAPALALCTCAIYIHWLGPFFGLGPR
jgi:hypothetical protein